MRLVAQRYSRQAFRNAAVERMGGRDPEGTAVTSYVSSSVLTRPVHPVQSSHSHCSIFSASSHSVDSSKSSEIGSKDGEKSSKTVIFGRPFGQGRTRFARSGGRARLATAFSIAQMP